MQKGVLATALLISDTGLDEKAGIVFINNNAFAYISGILMIRHFRKHAYGNTI